MLALRDYGSSDEDTGHESEKSSTNVESEEVKHSTNTDLTNEPFSVDKLKTPINLQICSAPDVVPTVSICVNIHFCFFYLDRFT